MLHTLIAIALGVHGIGHAVGFWMGVPTWFAVAWLLPGAGFLATTWGYARGAEWWPLAALASALASMALAAVARTGLQPGPYASAALFNFVVIAAVLVTQGRRLVAS